MFYNPNSKIASLMLDDLNRIYNQLLLDLPEKLVMIYRVSVIDPEF